MTCPGGGKALGGGAVWTAPTTATTTVESYPTSASSWRVRGANSSGGDKTLRALAICLD